MILEIRENRGGGGGGGGRGSIKEVRVRVSTERFLGNPRAGWIGLTRTEKCSSGVARFPRVPQDPPDVLDVLEGTFTFRVKKFAWTEGFFANAGDNLK